METIAIKLNERYPIYDTPTSVAKTDEYSGNEIQVIKRDAYSQGYKDAEEDFKEKYKYLIN